MIDIDYAKQVFHLEQENKILMDKIDRLTKKLRRLTKGDKG